MEWTCDVENVGHSSQSGSRVRRNEQVATNVEKTPLQEKDRRSLGRESILAWTCDEVMAMVRCVSSESDRGEAQI